ncbi:histidine--tRNA ligase [Sulfolobus sp. S-194]|uniref:histidine--tRNA ligase n=1 Tax=Sulfolobus sp. S-194 TaxID=2512240 RepID=UPI001436CFBD|nr:histidine--tRNA ligase [Sulfolobus sp. S-194]QIW23159.1 histidine--tRNA ligase [Sulfolobus sp. S-194]
MISYEPVRGMKDYYGEELYKIKVVENAFLKIVKLAGYQEVETPIVEDFQLFALKGGEELRNTMYVFKDKAGREVALRPEFTPSIVRFYLNSLQHLPKPIRLYYLGTVYRYDEPQFGRYREFRQAGIELLGSSNIYSDLEILQILIEIYRELNLINKIRLKINNISLIRKILNKLNMNDNLQEHFLHLIDKGKSDEALSLLPNSEYTELITNILGVSNLDISRYDKIKEDLTEKYNLKDLVQDLDRVMLLKNILDNLGVNSYIDLGFVRGLAYYTGLIFEVLHPSVSFSIAGGGRYDNLVELYGGPQTPAIGFAIGVERTALVLEEPNIVKEKQNKIGVIVLSDEAILYAIKIVDKLRSNNYIATINLKSISISKLIPSYAEEGYSFLIFIGKKEYEDKTVTLKNLSTKEQVTIKEENLLDYLKQII